MKRKNFLLSMAGGFFSTALLPLANKVFSKPYFNKYLRPPGALAEKQFLDKCIACGQCSNVCPNKCITLSGFESGLENLGTPKINARSKGCILCMACTQVCPTGALQKLEPTEEGRRAVAMGKAYVAEDFCFSYAGRTCGVCYHACPFPGQALKIDLFERPVVDQEVCVGCGLCEQACIHMPQAIRVVPAHAAS